ncbi:MAG: hypothetical protein QOG75_1219, partial [Mycobacterium sp.]|nr:hypothetical protein [Mycobacterium sp.]
LDFNARVLALAEDTSPVPASPLERIICDDVFYCVVDTRAWLRDRS